MSLRTKKNIWERWEQAKCDSMFSQCLILIIIIINNNINTEKKIKCLNASCFPLVIHVPFTMYPRPCSSCHLCQQFPFVYHRSHTHTYIYSYIERFVFVFLTFFFSFFHFFIHTQKSEKNENKLKSNMHAHTKRLMCSKMLYIAAPCVNQGLILCVSVHIFLMHNWINNVGHLVNIIINHFGPSFFSTLLLFCCRLKSLNMINEATFIFVCS